MYFKTVMLSMTLGIILYLTSFKMMGNKVLSLICTLVAMYMMRSFMAARVQLPTFILFVLTIYCIEMFLKTSKRRYVMGLLLIPVIIANIHVAVFPFYFVLFLPYIADYVAGKLFKLVMKDKLQELENKKKSKRKAYDPGKYKIVVTDNENMKMLMLTMVLAIFSGLLTPLGLAPYTYLPRTMQRSYDGVYN